MQLIGKNIIIRTSTPETIPQIIHFEKSNAPYVETFPHDKHLALLQDPDCLHLSILSRENIVMIGHMICFGLNKEHQALELRRITISKKGFGYGREVLQMIKKYCFEKLGFHRIWLDVYQDNFRAITLYESEGFI